MVEGGGFGSGGGYAFMPSHKRRTADSASFACFSVIKDQLPIQRIKRFLHIFFVDYSVAF